MKVKIFSFSVDDLATASRITSFLENEVEEITFVTQSSAPSVGCTETMLTIFYIPKSQAKQPLGIEVSEGNTESEELKRVPLHVFD